MKKYYVILDSEGYWLCTNPSEKDEIIFQSESLFEAEQRLCLELQRAQ